ncbi:hypothetical protein MKX01_031008, partial [Papaver californicum]
MNISCPHCGALHWMDERRSDSSLKNPRFGTCCLQGQIRLPPLRTPPPEIKALFDGNTSKAKHFRQRIRKFNSANAFTSLGCTLKPRILLGKGPPSFTIHGELR